MKKIIIIILLLTAITFSFGQNKEDYYIPKLNNKNSNFKNPPGTVKINDSLFVDASLVDNLMYLEFLYNVKNFWSERVSDTLKKLPNFGLNKILLNQKFQWMPIDESLYNEILLDKNLKVGLDTNMDIYLYHPKYAMYPAVNITQEQAEMYCKWRSDVVNIIIGIINSNKNEKIPFKVSYRLATYEELNIALKLYAFSKKIKNNFNEIPFNPMRLHYEKNHKKVIFNERNLSELTLDSKLFGTNWANNNSYNLPSDYIGFRCVCEIKSTLN